VRLFISSEAGVRKDRSTFPLEVTSGVSSNGGRVCTPGGRLRIRLLRDGGFVWGTLSTWEGGSGSASWGWESGVG
jgi:hypothetical protein